MRIGLGELIHRGPRLDPIEEVLHPDARPLEAGRSAHSALVLPDDVAQQEVLGSSHKFIIRFIDKADRIQPLAAFCFPKHSVEPERAAKVLLARRALILLYIGASLLVAHLLGVVFAPNRLSLGFIPDLIGFLAVTSTILCLFWVWDREQAMKYVRDFRKDGLFHVESASVSDEGLSWKDSLGGVNDVVLSPGSITLGNGLLMVWWKDRGRTKLTDLQAVLDLQTLQEAERKALIAQLSHRRVLA